MRTDTPFGSSMLLWTAGLFLAVHCNARLVNVTIDDHYGDALTGQIPTFTPADFWVPLDSETSPDPNFDFSQAYNGSMHRTNVPGNMSLRFNGTMIYMFFVVTTYSDIDLPFYLDGASKPSRRYIRKTPDGQAELPSPRYLYNQMVFQSPMLEPGTHHLLVSLQPFLELFDYAIYTTDDGYPAESSLSSLSSRGRTGSTGHGVPASTATLHPSTSTPSSPRRRVKLGVAIAAPVACAFVLLVVAFCAWYFRRRRRRAPREADRSVTAFFAQADPALSEESRSVPAKDPKYRWDDHRDSISPFLADQERAADAELRRPKLSTLGKEGASASAEPQPFASSSRRADPGPSGGAGVREHILPAGVMEELERARAEIAMLRQAAEPPPYSDHGIGSEHGEI